MNKRHNRALWGIPTHATQDRRVRKLQAALGHHLHQVTQTELVAQIPTYTQNDNLAVKVSSCKQLFQALQLAHSSDLTSPRSTLTALTSLFAPEPAGACLIAGMR